MKIECWMIGKTSFAYIGEGMDIYQKRMKKYISFDKLILPDVKNAKNMNAELLKQKEGEAILKKLQKEDFLILLDEKGKIFSSRQFAAFLNKTIQRSNKKAVFLIGGAFGFSEAVYQRANAKLSLSAMTFSHQMIRVFLIEQIYRGFTILNNEPYHND